MRIIICFGDRTRSGTFFTEKYLKSKTATFLSEQVCHRLLTSTNNQFPSPFRFIRYFNVNLEIKKCVQHRVTIPQGQYYDSSDQKC